MGEYKVILFTFPSHELVSGIIISLKYVCTAFSTRTQSRQATDPGPGESSKASVSGDL